MTLSVINLEFERNNQCLFQNINFAVGISDCLQIIGANGTGKTTLLRIIAGLIEPQKGEVLWQNKSIFSDRDVFQKQLHYIGHKNGLKPNLTLEENLQLNAALKNQVCDPSRLNDVLAQMDLSYLRYTQASQLSVGQARRLCLATLILNPLLLWILDEPMTGLDRDTEQLITSLIKNHLANEGIVIAATHQKLLPATKTLQLGANHDRTS